MTDKEIRELQKERTQAIINIWLTQTLLDSCEDSPEVTEEQIIASQENIKKWTKRAAEIGAILTEARIKYKIPDENGETGDSAFLQSIKPTLAIINNSLVDNKLIEIEKASRSGKSATVRVDKGGKGKIKVIASLSYDDKNVQITGKPLTPLDKTVHNAICSLYEAGNTVFTPDMVYRAMNGFIESERIVEKRRTLDPIIDSIETGRFRILRVNAEEQIKQYYPAVKQFTYENYFLPLEKMTVESNNGEAKEAYRFLAAPPLYDYSKNIKQVISVPIKLLDSRKTVKNSPTIAVIREYLIKRISSMKSEKTAGANSNNIKYSTIFENTGIDENKLSKTQRMRKRDQIKKILDYFVTENFIAGYAEYKKGRTYEGIQIQI